MSCDTLPGTMKVICHHINKIDIPDKVHERSRSAKQVLQGMQCDITNKLTLTSLRLHNRHQWFLYQQTQQQKSLTWAVLLMFPLPQRPVVAPINHRKERYIRGSCQSSVTPNLTLHNTVNLCLSSRGLPLAAGYSQSRSSPSKPNFLSSLIEDCINVFLLACVDTIVVNLWNRLAKERHN